MRKTNNTSSKLIIKEKKESMHYYVVLEFQIGLDNKKSPSYASRTRWEYCLIYSRYELFLYLSSLYKYKYIFIFISTSS